MSLFTCMPLPWEPSGSARCFLDTLKSTLPFFEGKPIIDGQVLSCTCLVLFRYHVIILWVRSSAQWKLYGVTYVRHTRNLKVDISVSIFPFRLLSPSFFFRETEAGTCVTDKLTRETACPREVNECVLRGWPTLFTHVKDQWSTLMGCDDCSR